MLSFFAGGIRKRDGGQIRKVWKSSELTNVGNREIEIDKGSEKEGEWTRERKHMICCLTGKAGFPEVPEAYAGILCLDVISERRDFGSLWRLESKAGLVVLKYINR